MNFLFCSAGRRCELLKDLKRSLGDSVKIVATDVSNVAPALYFADAHYIVPRIDDPGYFDVIFAICEQEEIDVITTLIDPEIPLLAERRSELEAQGITVLCPSPQTAQLCLDKYEFAKKLEQAGLPAVPTYGSIEELNEALEQGLCAYPLFVKPRKGSGSVGARKIESDAAMRSALLEDPSLIIQPYLADSEDLDADVYVDTVSHEVVSVFCKKKLSSTIGGANKTVSIKDEALVSLIERLAAIMDFNGPFDVDFFKNGDRYYISEVNPRFGGAYLHAYGAGVDFFKLIARNASGEENVPKLQDYDDGIYMLMYDSALITRL